MKHLIFAAMIIAVTAITGQPRAATVGARADAPVVVELFTSQGCYSCPPAEAFLRDLADQPGIVALEFHVDYWDSLNYLWHGRWKDPFSSPAHTDRQRRYNNAIRGQSGVYTPQMVIDGKLQAIGSRRDEVTRAIRQVRSSRKAKVSVQRSDHGLEVTVNGTARVEADVLLVRFINEATTEVANGENHGKTLVSRHIVRDLQPLGKWPGGNKSFAVPPASDGVPLDCAVIVQTPNFGPVLGAALCPKQPSS